MSSFKFNSRHLSKILPAFALLVLPGLVLAQEALNPNFFYLVKGEPIARGISLGDPTNWSTSIEGRSGESAGGKVSVAPTDFKAKGDALQITWSPRKQIQGNLGLYGNSIDLSKYKNAASITIDMRVDVKPNKDVRIGIDCGYPCKADLSINKMIRSMPKGEWFSLPLPLNCFKGDNFDLSKVAAPFTISTEGKFTMSVLNIRIEKLPEGDKGCAAES
jgi:hypothetical protein